jgi:hypothetical protein
LELSLKDYLPLGADWELVTDRVMGGMSNGGLSREVVAGREAARLTGQVSLENNGGFVQMAFDLHATGAAFDASGWTGIALDLCGNGEVYDLRLRTDQLQRPWQSFRTEFEATTAWNTWYFAFSDMKPHRTDIAFDPAHLRRIGVLAIGRRFAADVAVSRVQLYR